MSFFDSDIVRSEMAEISELQEEIFNNVMKFTYMNTEDQAHHIETLDKLITKASNNKSTRENLSKFIQSGDFLKVKSAKTGPITLPGRGQAVDEGLFQSIGKREATVVDEDFDYILTRIEKDLELEEARKKYAKETWEKYKGGFDSDFVTFFETFRDEVK